MLCTPENKIHKSFIDVPKISIPHPVGKIRYFYEGSEVGDPAEMGGAGDAVSCTDSGRGDTDTPDGEIYTDNTGTDLTQFIISTLNKNAKDRVLMLKLEQEMSNFIKDAKKNHHKFPHMSSYHRMMVHR